MSEFFHGAFDAPDAQKDFLDGSCYPEVVSKRIESVLVRDHGANAAHDIAFHLCDWISDAAGLVAVHLYPERFSNDEIEEIVQDVLSHAPAHLMAATHTARLPLNDVWELGIKIDS